MKLLSIIFLSISQPIFSAELICNLGAFDLKVETSLEACQPHSSTESVLTLRSGNSEKSVGMNCNVNVSNQYLSKNMLMSKELYLELEMIGSNSQDVLLLTNDQGIGFNRGFSKYTTEVDGKVETFKFSMIEDCSYIPFVQSYFNIPDKAPEDKTFSVNDLVEPQN